jgi:hypothetical protein
MSRALLLLPLFLSLSGCDKISVVFGEKNAPNKDYSGAAPMKAPVESDGYEYKFEINTQSPDQALKTWWRYLDAKAEMAVSRCTANLGKEEVKFDVSRITTGELEQTLNSRPLKCISSVFSREITEVKQETETRAIVFVKINNVTPSTVSHTSEQEKRRSEGEQYKYIIEKTSSGWKVSQAYLYSSTNKLLGKEDWGKSYSPYVESYPVYVFESQ